MFFYLFSIENAIAWEWKCIYASSLVKCWNVVEIVMWWHILTDIMFIFFVWKKNPNVCALAIHIGAQVVLKQTLNSFPTYKFKRFFLTSKFWENISWNRGRIKMLLRLHMGFWSIVSCIWWSVLHFFFTPLHTIMILNPQGCCLAYSCWFETKVQYWMPAVVCYVEMGWGAGG